MTAADPQRHAGALQRPVGPRGARFTPTGMELGPLLPFDEWKAIGEKIGMYSNGSAWWLGDWLAFGRMKYGRRYKEAVALTGLDYQTLRNYAVVARRFALSRRRDNLPFQHHAEVCALSDDDQDALLELAAAHHWSRNDLRRNLRAAGRTSAPSQLVTIVRLAVEDSRRRRWQRAAEAHHFGVEAWIVHTLDQAAASALERVEDRA